MQQRGRYHGTCHSSSWQHNQLAAQNTRDLEITSNLLSQFLVCTRQRFVAHHFTSEFTWKRKTFGPKARERNRKYERTGIEKKKQQKIAKKKKRNEKPAAHNNDERSQAAKLVSKITVCVYLCVCVRACAWGCVACLHYFYAMHGPRRVLTSFSYLNCPHIMPGQTNPTRLQLPRSHHPQLSPTQLNSTLNRAEQNSSRESLPVSRASCLEPWLSFHHHPWQWLAAGTGSKNMKTLPQIHNAPKKTTSWICLIFCAGIGRADTL